MIKIKVEITNGEGYHKIDILICDAEMKGETIKVAERLLWCGITEMEKSNSGLTV